MPQRVTVTVPDDHYKWLQAVALRRGWETVQDAIRSLIEDSYRLDKKLGTTQTDTPVSVKVAEVGNANANANV